MKENKVMIEGASARRASSFSLSEAYSFFGVDPDELKQLTAIALEKGGDYADFYFEYSTSDDLMLRDGEVSSVGSHIDYGVGVRVLSGEMTGYAYAEKTDRESIASAARMAASIADQPGNHYIAPEVVLLEAASNRYPILQDWEAYPVLMQKEFLKALDETVRSRDERIIKVIARLSHSYAKIFFYNSEGVQHTDVRPMASLSLSCIMKNGTRVENFSASRSFRCGSRTRQHHRCQG